MSLIDSIFGASLEDKNGSPPSNMDLFTTTTLPDPPLYSYSSRRSQVMESVTKSKKRKIPMESDVKNSSQAVHTEEEKEDMVEPDNAVKSKDDERTIFVGNLPMTFTRKKLRQLFLDCGAIHSTRIRCVPLPTKAANKAIKLPPALAGQQQVYKKVCINTSSHEVKEDAIQQSVNGYVVFADASSVELALRKHNTMVSDTSTTRHMQVDRVGTESLLRDPQRTIFIGNLPYRTDEESLHQHIMQHVSPENSDDTNHPIIESIRIVRDKETHLCKGFAYILFTSTVYVPIALRKLHQTTYMKQPLRIQVCSKRTKTSNAKYSQPPKTSSASSTPAAVGALRRVLKKQKEPRSPKKMNVRKRGPTRTTPKATPKKKSRPAQQVGKRIQHKIERHIQQKNHKQR